MSRVNPEIPEGREHEFAAFANGVIGLNGVIDPLDLRLLVFDLMASAYLSGKADGIKESREFFELMWPKEAP